LTLQRFLQFGPGGLKSDNMVVLIFSILRSRVDRSRDPQIFFAFTCPSHSKKVVGRQMYDFVHA